MKVYLVIGSEEEVAGVYDSLDQAKQEVFRLLYGPASVGEFGCLDLAIEEWQVGSKQCDANHTYTRRYREDPEWPETFEKRGYTLLRKFDNSEKAWYKEWRRKA